MTFEDELLHFKAKFPLGVRSELAEIGRRADACRIRAEQAEARLAAIDAAPPADLGLYDAGKMNDYGGGNVEWWWDYMRAELGRAHDFYTEQAGELIARPAKD